MAIRRMTPASGAGTNPFETPRMNATIVGVEVDTSRVMCRDTFGNEFIIDGSLRAKGSGMPVSGERWILAKVGGRWTLDMQVGAAPAPIIVGDAGGLNPVVKQMLKAMADLGLVVNLTSDSDPAEVVFDDTTDPYVPSLGDGDFAEDDYEDYPSDDPYYTEAVVPVGSTVDDDKVPGSKVSTDLISVCTYNQIYSLGVQRATQDIKRLCAQVDLIGLQECVHGDRTPALNARPANWGMYRPAGGGIGNVILWNKDVLKNLDEGTQQLSGFDGPGTKRPARAANWVKFEHRPTGVIFVFVDTHLENAAAVPGYYVPNFKPDSERHVVRFKEQMATITPLLQSLTSKTNVLLVGDLNVRSGNDLKLRHPNLPTAAWGRFGMRSNWDILGQPAIGTSGGGNTIDQKYLSSKVPGQMKFVSSKVMRGYNSDHKPVITKIRIKNFA